MAENENGEITAQEKLLVDQLREKIEKELPKSVLALSNEDQDLYLVRWLRARDLNLEKAEKMLQSSLKWRVENKADEKLELIPSPFYKQTFPYEFVGPDKAGHPVLLIPLAEWDFRKLFDSSKHEFKQSEFDDFTTHYFEIVVSKIREAHLNRKAEQPHVTEILILLDVQSYPYGQLLSIGAMKKLLQMASVYEAHYPEILFKGIFINCPSYFSIFIKMLRTVMAPRTLGKLVCYPQIADWRKDMVDLVDPAVIPERYGGTFIAGSPTTQSKLTP